MTTTNSPPKAKPASAIATPTFLIIYGIPPEFEVFDAQGRSLGKKFQLNKSNKTSFETALKIALGAFLGSHADLARANIVHIRNAEDTAKQIKNATANTHVVYYGHAIAEEKKLAPSKGERITVDQLARMLKGSSISHFDLLGCSSVGIAAELAISIPGISFGGLMNKRSDDFEVDHRTLQVRKMSIAKQEFLHFGAAGK
jgi:hypothetical protein